MTDSESKPQTDYRTLNPPIEPYETGTLAVSGGHSLYWEQSGNPNGKPVVVLHGGPGGGSHAFYRCYFDPQAYRIVLFDQRGAGRSTPSGSLEENTTWHLVDDIEALRVRLHVERWMVFGGSWGSTLALCYAQTHPARVTALVLRGIFLCRRQELVWFYQCGASHLFPDYWEQFLQPIPLPERADLMSAYHRRLTGADARLRVECAREWAAWEMATSRLHISPDAIRRARSDEQWALAFARIEAHYFVHGAFLRTDNQLLEDIARIRQHRIPGTIVQGRYDVVCPCASAWELHRAWPEAEFVLVPDAGHSVKELGITDALLRATDHYRTL